MKAFLTLNWKAPHDYKTCARTWVSNYQQESNHENQQKNSSEDQVDRLLLRNGEQLFSRSAQGFTPLSKLQEALPHIQKKHPGQENRCHFNAFAYAYLKGAKNFDLFVPEDPDNPFRAHQASFERALQELASFEQNGKFGFFLSRKKTALLTWWKRHFSKPKRLQNSEPKNTEPTQPTSSPKFAEASANDHPTQPEQTEQEENITTASQDLEPETWEIIDNEAAYLKTYLAARTIFSRSSASYERIFLAELLISGALTEAELETDLNYSKNQVQRLVKIWQDIGLLEAIDENCAPSSGRENSTQTAYRLNQDYLPICYFLLRAKMGLELLELL